MSDKIEACAWCGKKPLGPPGKCLHNCLEADFTIASTLACWNEVMHAVRMMRRLREPVGPPKDDGIDLTHLPKGKPTAYSEGGPAR